MKFWMLVVLAFFFAGTYYFIQWLFWLSAFIFGCYLFYRLYRLIERLMTPKGKRIRHGALRGHLDTEYGTTEGGKLYKEMVGELRKRGYR